MIGRNITTMQPLIGRRREARLRVQLEARLILLEGSARATLLDLSRWGARILLPGLVLHTRHEGVLQWDRFENFGMLVWSDGRQFGMVFEQALPAEAVVSTRAIEDGRQLSPEQRLRDSARMFVQGRRQI